MKWLDKLFGTVEQPKVVEQVIQEESKQPEFSALNYSPRQYRAYWETIMTPNIYGYAAEIRFMSRAGQVLEVHNVENPSLQRVNELVQKLVVEKMDNFKV